MFAAIKSAVAAFFGLFVTVFQYIVNIKMVWQDTGEAGVGGGRGSRAGCVSCRPPTALLYKHYYTRLDAITDRLTQLNAGTINFYMPGEGRGGASAGPHSAL